MATKNSINSNDPIEVALGGTGNATLTNHGVLVGAGTSAITQLSVGGNNTVLQGTAASDPAFTATPTVTSITFGAGSALSTFVDWTTWTPTLDGSSSGASTYVFQNGYYTRIGNIAVIQFAVQVSAATGTGDLQIGGLPFAIHNATNGYVAGACVFGGTGVTFPVGGTSPALLGIAGNSFLNVYVSGTAFNVAKVQMANTTISCFGQITYRI